MLLVSRMLGEPTQFLLDVSYFHCVSTYCQYGSAQSAGQLPLENLPRC